MNEQMTMAPSPTEAPTPQQHQDRPVLGISLRTAIGTGPTELAAFDAALRGTNIANFNLLLLSSVIPPASDIQVLDDPGQHRPAGEWGDKLYVVMAEQRTSTPGQTVAAGVGWVQDDRDGSGLFVEHEGFSAADVERDLRLTMGSMVRGRGMDFGKVHTVVESAVCGDEPTCAMVVAVYEHETWHRG